MPSSTFWTALLLSVLALLTQAVPTIDLDYAPHSQAMRFGIQGADKIRAFAVSLRPIGNVQPYLASSASSGKHTPLLTPALLHPRSLHRRAGNPGAVVLAESTEPPTFFLKSGRLFSYVNQTSLLFVNVIDPWTAKKPTRLPARPGLYNVELSTKQEGMDGEFYWVGDSLHFSDRRLPPPLPQQNKREVPSGEKMVRRGGGLTKVLGETNDGLWFACQEINGAQHGGLSGRALYVDFKGYEFHKRSTPDGCDPFTMHSLGAQFP